MSIWYVYIYTFYILMHSIWNVYEKYYVYNKYTKRIPYVSYTFRILYMSIQKVYKTYISIGKVWHTFHILFIYSCEYIKRIAYLFVTYYIRFVYVLYTRLFDISSVVSDKLGHGSSAICSRLCWLVEHESVSCIIVDSQ